MSPEQLREISIATDLKRQQRELLLTPEQRMERFVALQEEAWTVLSSNPEALEAFHNRNRRKRRQSEVHALLSKLRPDQNKHEPT